MHSVERYTLETNTLQILNEAANLPKCVHVGNSFPSINTIMPLDTINTSLIRCQ